MLLCSFQPFTAGMPEFVPLAECTVFYVKRQNEKQNYDCVEYVEVACNGSSKNTQLGNRVGHTVQETLDEDV